jgi:Ser/Thr protein kinase RdoA (MazF antagonist)
MPEPDETDLFLSLTPEKVLTAVEAGGLECNAVCYPLNSFENRVYEVELADRSRVVAKFYRPGRWN